MNYDVKNSLSTLAELLETAKNDWWLLGGGAFWLYGIGDGTLKDIDIVMGLADAQRIARRLGLHPLKLKGASLFRSKLLLQWRELAIPVEFMARLEVKTDCGWNAILPSTRVEKFIGGKSLYVPSAAELIKIATKFGRPKDLARATELRKML